MSEHPSQSEMFKESVAKHFGAIPKPNLDPKVAGPGANHGSDVEDIEVVEIPEGERPPGDQ